MLADLGLPWGQLRFAVEEEGDLQAELELSLGPAAPSPALQSLRSLWRLS